MNDTARNIRHNLKLIRDNCQKFSQQTELIAVSKYTSIESIRFAYQEGQTCFGESRPQDLIEKSNQLQDLTGLRWHFIGNLQTNKVKKLLTVSSLEAIHSVDSKKLLEKIITAISDCKREMKLKIFLQINTSGEGEKSGFTDYREIIASIQAIIKCDEFLDFEGLMTMGKIRTDNLKKDAEICFKKLQDIGEKIKKDLEIDNIKFSMGMSSDYKIALACGANYLRIGQNIFQ